jgi:hypothetical protein
MARHSKQLVTYKNLSIVYFSPEDIIQDNKDNYQKYIKEAEAVADIKEADLNLIFGFDFAKKSIVIHESAFLPLVYLQNQAFTLQA